MKKLLLVIGLISAPVFASGYDFDDLEGFDYVVAANQYASQVEADAPMQIIKNIGNAISDAFSSSTTSTSTSTSSSAPTTSSTSGTSTSTSTGK